MKWEYTWELVGNDTLNSKMNELGSEGWQLICTTPDKLFWIFKRPKENKLLGKKEI